VLHILLSDLRDLLNWLSEWLLFRRQSFKMSLAIRLADMKQRAFNRQYHVMLMALPKGDRLVSANRDEIMAFRRKKWLPPKTGMAELQRSIFYSTPLNRNNRSTPRERADAKRKYLRYACRNSRFVR
jgi:hypothetical protein